MKRNSYNLKKYTENDILDAIMQYLWYNKIFAWRTNNIPVYDPKFSSYRAMPKWAIKGVSDILGIRKINGVGQMIAIEVKRKGKYPSKDQKEFLKRINKEGGIAFVARSIDDVSRNLQRADERQVQPSSRTGD